MGKQSSTFSYLAELRKRLIAVAVFFVVSLAIGLAFSKKLVVLFLNSNLPEDVSLITLSPYESASLFIHFMFFVAIALTVPFFIYQLIMYLKPGLTKSEKRVAVLAPFIAIFLFVIGSGFGFLVTKRVIVPFLSNLALSIGVTNNWSINQFMMFIIYLSIAMGLIFQMPLVISLLVKFNILNPRQIKKSRKYVIIGLLIFAAIITPPDLFSLIIIVIPMIILFEITLLIARFMRKDKVEKEVGK